MSRIPHNAGRVPYSICTHAPYDLPEYRGGGAVGGAPSYTYATLSLTDRYAPDPDPALGNPVLSVDLLTATGGGGWGAVRATQGKLADGWYCECELVTSITGFIFGVATAAHGLTYHGDSGQNGWGIGVISGAGYNASPGSVATNGTSPIVGDVFGCEFIRSTDTVYLYLNGTEIVSFSTAAAAGVELFPMFSVYASSGTSNFGATTLAHAPAHGGNPGVYV